MNKKDELNQEINKLKEEINPYIDNSTISEIIKTKKYYKEQYIKAKKEYKHKVKIIKKDGFYILCRFVAAPLIISIALGGGIAIAKSIIFDNSVKENHYSLYSYDSQGRLIHENDFISDEENSYLTIKTPYEKYNNCYRKKIYTIDASKYSKIDLIEIVDNGYLEAINDLVTDQTNHTYEYTTTISDNNDGYIGFVKETLEYQDIIKKEITPGSVIVGTLVGSIPIATMAGMYWAFSLEDNSFKALFKPNYLKNEIGQEKGIDLNEEKRKVKTKKKEYKNK